MNEFRINPSALIHSPQQTADDLNNFKKATGILGDLLAIGNPTVAYRQFRIGNFRQFVGADLRELIGKLPRQCTLIAQDKAEPILRIYHSGERRWAPWQVLLLLVLIVLVAIALFTPTEWLIAKLS